MARKNIPLCVLLMVVGYVFSCTFEVTKVRSITGMLIMTSGPESVQIAPFLEVQAIEFVMAERETLYVGGVSQFSSRFYVYNPSDVEAMFEENGFKINEKVDREIIFKYMPAEDSRLYTKSKVDSGGNDVVVYCIDITFINQEPDQTEAEADEENL